MSLIAMQQVVSADYSSIPDIDVMPGGLRFCDTRVEFAR